MSKKVSSIMLGASLYAPAVRPDLSALANGERYPHVRSVILCAEDSILESQLDAAIGNLACCFQEMRDDRPLVFARPRNLEIAARILSLPGVEKIDGFVLPKIDAPTFRAYADLVPERFFLMPTLETKDVFDPGQLICLRDAMLAPRDFRRIPALRIGGNDILNFLGLRRRPGRTIYDTAAGAVIASVVCCFKPFGFSLTAPVFDDFGDSSTLIAEVGRDIEHGLIGKTAIHPDQVDLIERQYRVQEDDLLMARQILRKDSAAVFQIDRVMCEPATHSRWAELIVEQAAVYGVIPSRRKFEMQVEWA